MAVPQPIKTVPQILAELNGEGNVGPWVMMPQYYGITTIVPTAYSLNFYGGKGGTVFAAFMNTSNMEVKFYIAKWLDIPERANLFPPET